MTMTGTEAGFAGQPKCSRCKGKRVIIKDILSGSTEECPDCKPGGWGLLMTEAGNKLLAGPRTFTRVPPIVPSTTTAITKKIERFHSPSHEQLVKEYFEAAVEEIKQAVRCEEEQQQYRKILNEKHKALREITK